MAGARLEVTLEDASRIKASLLQRLEASDLPEKAQLTRTTSQLAPSIDMGTLRIGIWLLGVENDGLRLTYRGPFGPSGARLYKANVARDGDAWRVENVERGEVLVRR